MGLRDFPVPDMWWASNDPPATPMQALLEAPPGEEPRQSALETDETLSEMIAQALADMDPDDVEMVMLHVSGFSVREIGSMLGMDKMRVHRKLPELMKQVGKLLKSNESVVRFVEAGESTDEQEIVSHVRPDSDDGPDSEGG